MAVRKVQVRGRTMWRARVIRNGRERTAFCDRKDEAMQADAVGTPVGTHSKRTARTTPSGATQ